MSETEAAKGGCAGQGERANGDGDMRNLLGIGYSSMAAAVAVEAAQAMADLVILPTMHQPGRMVRNWHKSHSKYRPHQGKRECARRLRQASSSTSL